MPRADSPGVWMELDLERRGAEVWVGARGSRRERVDPRPLGPELGAERLEAFAVGVRHAAARGKPLGESLLAEAQALYAALFRDGIGELRGRLREAAGGRGSRGLAYGGGPGRRAMRGAYRVEQEGGKTGRKDP